MNIDPELSGAMDSLLQDAQQEWGQHILAKTLGGKKVLRINRGPEPPSERPAKRLKDGPRVVNGNLFK